MTDESGVGLRGRWCQVATDMYVLREALYNLQRLWHSSTDLEPVAVEVSATSYSNITPQLHLSYTNRTPHVSLSYTNITPHVSLSYTNRTPHRPRACRWGGERN